MKRFVYILLILIVSYILFNLALGSDENTITGYALLTDGSECSSGSECQSNYCDFSAGIGVGICTQVPQSTCIPLNYLTCGSSLQCYLWAGGDQCLSVSLVTSSECTYVETQSECSKISSVCEWVPSLIKCQAKGLGYCGNNKIDQYEICDGTDLAGKTCTSWPTYTGGILKCHPACESYDISSCTVNCDSFSAQQCSTYPQCIYYSGDGMCTKKSYISDTSGCLFLNQQDCSKISLCEYNPNKNICQAKGIGYCGNNRIDSGEQCDLVAFNSKTCITQGFLSGSLRCKSDCTLDTSSCSNVQAQQQVVATRISLEDANKNLPPVTQVQPNIQDMTLDELNTPPVISLQQTTFELTSNNFIEILNLKDIVYDNENDRLTYSLGEYDAALLECRITSQKLQCKKKSQQTGEISLTLKASDAISEASETITIKIGATVLEQVSKEAVGSGFFEENTPPVANAGLDQVVQNKRIIVLDASSSYDKEDNIPSAKEAYSWFYNNNKIAIGRVASYKFSQVGSYEIELEVTDSLGLSSKDSVIINVIEKNKCKETNSVYYPEDTICNKKWPSTDGNEIFINTKDYSCNLVEVCSEELDPMVEEAINCCDGSILTNTGSNKVNACLFANKNSNGNSKRCQALYTVNSLGANAVYMQDYLEAEMCCAGVDSLCTNPSNLFKALPIPKTNSPLNLNEITCRATSENNKGKWISDYDIKLNNIALTDIPAHATLTKLMTGTCVDYSLALTTLLRKSGYSSSEVYTVEASDHAYNLVRLPLDKKYTLIDTTGNNNGIKLGSVPYGYPYCENIVKCYNDLGEMPCPSLKDVNGCENVPENLLLQTSRAKAELTQNVKGSSINIFKRIIGELGL